ncbi:YihY/virulence factor BrkB family protein [Agromyces sp. Marseille-P2726]|uniref:YihY/virulence factor BrkB family protein n=1 Tax=Agromyces sp. Marseille-P2726 TaxID=2709132 RepID=UPI0020C1E355|nr:YihY/virulence factor BrkB family protein [Agromyces sp. Marseille-P2726]
MSERTPRSDAAPDAAGDRSAAGEAGARERFDAFSQPIRERLEEPISRVSTITRKTMALFPVRVWRHFLARNGFLLSSGMSYQALFAIFAAVYVVFAVAGIWLTGDPETLNAFVTLLNTYAPGLIGDNGIITTDDLTEIATSSTSLFGLTGAVALVGLIWTAIGWVTYSRLAVRSIFGLPKDTRAYALLKARDFLAALVFGTALLIAAVLSAVTTSFLGWLTDLTGIDPSSGWSTFLLQAGGFAVVFGIDTLALAVLFRFLSGAAMPWRRMWIGSLLGSAALTVLQLVSGFLVSRVSTNPLLATFTVFIGLLLWFRLVSIVILVAASWVAVEASDHNESLRAVTPEQLLAEQRERERRALVTAAEVRVRQARSELADAKWWERVPARRKLARAEAELERAEAAAMAPAAASDVGGLP